MLFGASVSLHILCPLPGHLLFTYDSPAPTLGIPVESPTPSALGRASSPPRPVTSQPSIFIASAWCYQQAFETVPLKMQSLDQQQHQLEDYSNIIQIILHISGSGAWVSGF